MDQTSNDYEVIVVDNGSQDESVEFVRSTFPNVKMIENYRNLGFSQGNNVGIQHAAGDFVILLNNDTVVREDFVEVLENIASSEPTIGSVGCRIVQVEGGPAYGPIFTNRGFVVPWLMGASFSFSRIERSWAADGFCFANCGAAVLYRKAALQAVGGLDPDFWADWEDHDLGFRLWVAGYKSYYTTKTCVVHHGAGSFGRVVSGSRFRRIISNTLLTCFKNYEPRNILVRFFIFFWFLLPFRTLGSSISRIIRKRFSATAPPVFGLLAYLEVIRHLPLYMKKRAQVQSMRRTRDSEIFRLTEKNWLL
jgi:GT2 family glycosyltransferase